MNNYGRGSFAALLVVAASIPVLSSAQNSTRASIIAAVDSIASERIASGTTAGMSVAVVVRGDTIVMRGYGHVDLEWDVPTPPDAVYEIASVTKQFTAAAIMQLAEAGLLRVDADIREYLPDFPDHGAHISVSQLLDHTSGIRGYTELPGFSAMTMVRFPADSVLALFKNLPLDFQPGDALAYSNSGYFLLGLIIEKVAGVSYANYVRDRLFTPAGMQDSRYCSESEIIRHRANGYESTPTGLVRAAYLDHSWPFSAGSLCSTVGDLAAWTKALHGGRVLGPAAYQALITPGKLNDGVALRYAKGLLVDNVNGHLSIRHGGVINGFRSELRYYPQTDMIIAVLINTGGGANPNDIATAIGDHVLGKRPQIPVKLDIDPKLLLGVYKGPGRGKDVFLNVTRNGTINVQINDGPPSPLVYLGNLIFTDAHTQGAWPESIYRFVRDGRTVNSVHRDAGSVSSWLRRVAER